MARDGAETRDRLVTAAQRLYADHGIWRTTSRQIIDAAGQRNVSAIAYHFGSREGLLREILNRHGVPLDDDRGSLHSEATEDSAREVVRCLTLPLAAKLHSADGRCYLRILNQLAGYIDMTARTEFIAGNLARLLDSLEDGLGHLPEPIRRERVDSMVLLMLSVFARRASRLEVGDVAATHEEFVANLIDMLTALLEAGHTEPGAAQSE